MPIAPLFPIFAKLFVIVILAGAVRIGFEYLMRQARHKRQDRLLGSGRGDSFRDLSWHDFEEKLVAAFRQDGYEIESQPKAGADGGVDIVLRKDGQRVFVQCKHWKDQVGAKIVRELFGVMADKGVSKGKVVSTGGFTDEAREFAERNGITLMDGGEVAALLDKVRPQTVAAAPAKASNARACPKCAGPMLLRENHETLATFWGCRRFPKCRGTLPA